MAVQSGRLGLQLKVCLIHEGSYHNVRTTSLKLNVNEGSQVVLSFGFNEVYFRKTNIFCRRRSLVNIRTQVKEIMFNAIALFLSRTAVRTKENNKSRASTS